MNATAKQFFLSDLAAISAGHPIRGSAEDLPSGDVALLQMRDIENDLSISWHLAIQIEVPGKRSPNYLRPSDLVFTSRGTRNLAVLIDEDVPMAICAPNLFVIRVGDDGVCLPEYLAWFMNQRPAQAYFQRAATGTNILNIRREVVEQLVVPVPSLSQQSAIVELDNTARRERELLRSLITNREQQMEALALGLAGCMEA
jgi:restriction endonuclease S subunit